MIDRELTCHTGGIGDGHLEAMTLLVGIEGLFMASLVPDDAVEVGIDGPCDGCGQTVAVDILHIAHGEVHRTFVDLTRLCLDIDHEIGELVVPREGQTGELTPVAYRRTVALVRLCAEIIHEQDLLLLDDIAVGILEDASVLGREDELHDIRGVTLDLREREEVDQTHLFAVG